jgi:excisionase family DNA binding protein
MARIFDVIEYPNEMTDELVHRFPEEGVADLRIGSQVIVRESQRVVFMRDGQALDTFGPGRHTIATANIPYLINFIGKAFNDRTPFTAEVYYISVKEFPDRKWGTAQPIIVRNQGIGLGIALLTGYGTYSFQIGDPQQFLIQIVGAKASYGLSDIEDRLRTMLLSKIQDVLAETGAKKNVLEMIALTEELGTAVRVKASDDFSALGLILKSFYIGSLKPSDKSAEELRSMGMLDMQTYAQLQAADAMREAANNPNGGAGLTAGIGAGLGIGNVLNQSLQGISSNQAAQQQATQNNGVAASVMQMVMTPAEAAAVLRVSEADVLSAITSGDLKAKKIGDSYRISKESLDAYLRS